MNISFDLHGQKIDMQFEMPTPCLAGALNPEIVQTMMRIVRPGDTVIDGGAYVGYFTILLSKLVGPAGHVIAIEPGQNNLPYLYTNIVLNQARNVTVIPHALWSKANEVKTLYLVSTDVFGEGGLANSLSDPAADKTTALSVLTVTLNQFLPARLIKLDIEGAEGHTLRTIQNYSDAPYIIAELNNEALPRIGDSCVAVRQLMHSKGYDTFLLREHIDKVPILLQPHQGFVTEKVSADVLFSTVDAVNEAYNTLEAVA